MLLPLRFWDIAVRCPTLFQGATLHRAGLLAASAGRFALADALFESAAGRYRQRLMVPALARLRVHQLMASAEACFDDDRDAVLEYSGEIERRLQSLDTIEDLEPPFREIRARDLLAHWTDRISPPAEARAA
ncbi:MAG: hypothetical protein ABIS67_06570 [Candidatus Eisenbacteria bacterium]